MLVPPKPVGPKLPESSFTNGLFESEFLIPSSVFDYLQNYVNKSYQIEWNIEKDSNVTWLMPYRLLMFINIQSPNMAWNPTDLQLKIDGNLVDSKLIKNAYNSRFPEQKCYMGFYLDVTQQLVAPDVKHNISVNIPSEWNLNAGQFRGIFWDNLEASFFAQ